ncbi:hypothetical protein BDR07DRAFT_877977 [Suillus spraguei]|nr:hypothetical protein BDR07DRAFT_877977 [Suillus spraguei]
MMQVVMIARLHALYQRSRTMLIFLVIICLAVNIACGAIAAIGLSLRYLVGEELILSGTYQCAFLDGQLLPSLVWILNTVWEVLVLCLSARIAVKHFRDLRRLGPLTGSTIGNCLIKSHVLYFACFAGVSCFEFITLSPAFSSSGSIGSEIVNGAQQILFAMHMFVLGPRLILSIREYHAKLVANSDAACTCIN